MRAGHSSINSELPVAGRTLSVVSLNTAKETNPNEMVSALDRAPRFRQADLFLLQEVVDADGAANAAGDVAQRLGT